MLSGGGFFFSSSRVFALRPLVWFFFSLSLLSSSALLGHFDVLLLVDVLLTPRPGRTHDESYWWVSRSSRAKILSSGVPGSFSSLLVGGYVFAVGGLLVVSPPSFSFFLVRRVFSACPDCKFVLHISILSVAHLSSCSSRARILSIASSGSSSSLLYGCSMSGCFFVDPFALSSFLLVLRVSSLGLVILSLLNASFSSVARFSR